MTISAKMLADSISDASPRLCTLQLRYPKFIHGELMTHRVFSRNASSSRAIPVERMIQDVIDDPVYPSHWGKNQKGMSADEECDADVFIPGVIGNDMDYSRKEAWDEAKKSVIMWAMAFDKAGYHKQIVNRLLEPFCHINVVVTATEWQNFFALRDHPGAQPEIMLLAREIKLAMAKSEPRTLRPGEWHLPYVTLEDRDRLMPRELVPVSVARCARVSYLTQEGKNPSTEEDLKLYKRLMGSVPLHASPAEHQATPDKILHNPVHEYNYWEKKELHGNLVGWIQYRKTMAGENQDDR